MKMLCNCSTERASAPPCSHSRWEGARMVARVAHVLVMKSSCDSSKLLGFLQYEPKARPKTNLVTWERLARARCLARRAPAPCRGHGFGVATSPSLLLGKAPKSRQGTSKHLDLLGKPSVKLVCAHRVPPCSHSRWGGGAYGRSCPPCSRHEGERARDYCARFLSI